MSITTIFHTFFSEPILKALIFIQNVIPGHDFGWAIIILTVLIRLLLWPLASQSIRSQKALQELQPEMNAIKEKYKDQKEKQAQAMMALYKEKKINPAAGCLPLLIQLPILFALYFALQKGIDLKDGGANFIFLGVFDLTQKYNIIFGVLTGILQYFQTKMLMVSKANVKSAQNNKESSEDFSHVMNKQMLYIMPLILAYTAYSFSAGIALYLVVTTAFSVVQQYYTMKQKPSEK